MSQKNICSRREADELIRQGLVMVNGQVAQLGFKVTEEDQVTLLPLAQKQINSKITILINKPLGVVSAQAENGYKSAVDLISLKSLDKKYYTTQKSEWNQSVTQHLAPAGRLDINSKGLLVLTQDGVLAKQIIGPHSNIEKEYFVQTTPSLKPSHIEKLKYGLKLDGQMLKRATVVQLDKNSFSITLLQGKKRQIRRSCEKIGLTVTHLKRIRIGQIHLKNLKEGCWRFLEDHETF